MSADSTPTGYAARRSPWVPPLFLAAIAAASAGVAAVAGPLAHAYALALAALTGTDASVVERAHATVSIRPFGLVLFVLLALFAPGSWRSRLRLLLAAVALDVALTLLVDAVLLLARPAGAPAPLSSAGGVVAAISALVAAVVLLFTRYTLPPGVRVPTEVKRPWPLAALFVTAVAGAICVVLLVDAYGREILRAVDLPALAAFTSMAAIGVIGLQAVLFATGGLRRRRFFARGPLPSVAFLVPAHNEEESVAATIRALDGAATLYDGTCRLYLVDNASRDRTPQRAADALAGCAVLTGRVLHCRPRGKSHALNYGLLHTTEDIVVRVDADTLVRPSLLLDVIPHFAAEDVGGVSGIPLPRRDTPRLLRALRLMEVLYAVGFLRTAQGSVDATLVMPGNMSAYRGALVRRLGGFASGFNGEDTDVAVRIGRLGYRIVTDTRIHFFTEVPTSIGHLVEQRQRWSRGVFYVTARNKSSIVLRQGLRGLVLLPWSAIGACRRAVTAPLLVSVCAASAVDPSLLSFRQVAVFGGALVGANLLVVAVILLLRARLDALPFLPAYAVFRLFKLYVAFAAFLTLMPKAPRARPAPAPELVPAPAVV